jgi:hypothetical protein
MCKSDHEREIIERDAKSELAAANAKLASVRELQGYTMEGCYLLKSESPFKGNWNGDYVATADLEKLLFSPTMRAVDEEVGR